MTVTKADRILGCPKGIATGNAFGKQTEMLSRDEMIRWYPHASDLNGKTHRERYAGKQ
jgi:hypothetical protein